MSLAPVMALIFAAQPVTSPQTGKEPAAVSASAGAGVTLVDGQRPAATIVIPAAPTRTVRYAADELVYHVRKATGVTLAVIGEDAAQPGSPAGRVFLGPTAAAARAGIAADKLAPDAFTLRVQSDALLIAGRDSEGDPLVPDTWSGTLFGVYQVLEDVLGVRWLWPGELGEHVPAAQRVVVPPQDRTIAPQLIIRRLRSTLHVHRGQADTPDDFSAAAQAQARADEAQWLRRQRMGHSRKMRWGHAFTDWWQRYGQEHPEWFNLLEDGQRRPQSGADGARTAMCVSNPQFHEEIVRRWLEACAASPDNKPNINGCENDVFGRCQCPGCKAWDAPRTDAKEYPPRFSDHGIVSDRYARFWRTVQELAAKHDPDAIVTGYAYVNYAPPPVRERLNEHVWIGLVPDAFFPRTPEEHRQCLAMWEGWAGTGCRLFLRPNYTLDGYCLPYLYMHQFADEFAHHARQGMIATDFDSLTAMWATQGPQIYLFARWQSCLDRTVDEVLAEYYGGFGPAAGAVQAYFDYWEKYTTDQRESFREVAERVKAGWSSFPRLVPDCYPPAAFARGEALLAAAASAAGDSAVASVRVAFLQKGLTHAIKCAVAARARAGDDLFAAQQAVLDLRSYRQQIERDNVANLSYCAQLEQRAFRQSHREVVYDGTPLRPLGNRPVASDLKPVSLRGDFGIVGLMKRGQEFRVTITAKRVGHNTEPVRWAIYGPDRLLLEKGNTALGSTQTVVRAATAEGIYNLTLSTSPNAAQVVLHGPGMGILGQRLNLIGASGPVTFFVPPGTKQFRVTLSSPAPGETAALAILDPDGREAARGETGTADEVPLEVAVPAGAAGTAWTVVPSKGAQGVLEDYSITLGPGLPPFWSLSPDQLLVPATP